LEYTSISSRQNKVLTMGHIVPKVCFSPRP
jgi:hypothetical protein